MLKSELETQLSRLHQKLNALLTHSAYSTKAQQQQLARMEKMKDLDREFVERGVLTEEEARDHGQAVDREIAIVRRAFRLRRRLAARLAEELEETLSRAEKDQEDLEAVEAGEWPENG